MWDKIFPKIKRAKCFVSNVIQHLCEDNFGRFCRFCLKLRCILFGPRCSAGETGMETIYPNLKRALCRSTVNCLVYRFRDTTLMPNIRGLMPLVALLFAPYAEMRYETTLFVCVLSASHLICEDSSKLNAFHVFLPHILSAEKIYPSIYIIREDCNIWTCYVLLVVSVLAWLHGGISVPSIPLLF